MHKFRGIEGYEFFIDGFGGTSEEGVYATLFNDQGLRLIAGRLWGAGNKKTSYAIPPPGLMKTLTTTAYTKRDGQPIYAITIPVADRIPDDLLDDLRRDPKGTLRIKIRLHLEGVLLGWDIERRPGYDPKKRNVYGNPIFVSAVHSFAGGDFREAEIINGQAVRKGWYIHPKTGQRIETDF